MANIPSNLLLWAKDTNDNPVQLTAVQDSNGNYVLAAATADSASGGDNLIGSFDETSTIPSSSSDGVALNGRNRVAINVSLGTRDSWEFGVMGYDSHLDEWIYIEPLSTDSGAVTTSVASKVISTTVVAPVSIPLELAGHIERIAVYHISAAGTSTTAAKCKVVGA